MNRRRALLSLIYKQTAPSIPDNEIWYTSSDGNVVAPYSTDDFGANIVSNNCTNGQGIISFDGSVTTIGEAAFESCTNLTSITIPDSVTTIGGGAFAECSNLTSVTIPDSVTEIEWSAFYSCSNITSVTIGKSVTSIGDAAFYNCDSLTSVNIPDSITSIGNYAFVYCTSLTSVTIGDGVTTIGDEAFSYCYSLTSVYCKATTPPALAGDYETTYVFDSNGSGRKIYVPMESVEAYKSARYWRNYASAIVGYDFGDGEESGGQINITVPLDDSGYGEFTNEQIQQITNYCLQFGESNATGAFPAGFSLTINSIPMDEITWMQYNEEIIIQGSTYGEVEFFIGLGDKYVQFK